MSILILALALAQPAQSTTHAGHGAHAGHSAQAAPAAPAAKRWSVATTKIEDLLANPAAKAILEKHLPGISNHPQLSQALPMTLKAVQPFSGGMITDDHLKMIEAELAALPAS